MNLVFHISEDGSQIELKHCASSKTSIKSSRKYFVYLNWIRLTTNLQDLKYVNCSTLVDINDVDNSVNSWCKCFTDLADMHAPIKKMKVRGISIP